MTGASGLPSGKRKNGTEHDWVWRSAVHCLYLVTAADQRDYYCNFSRPKPGAVVPAERSVVRSSGSGCTIHACNVMNTRRPSDCFGGVISKTFPKGKKDLSERAARALVTCHPLHFGFAARMNIGIVNQRGYRLHSNPCTNRMMVRTYHAPGRERERKRKSVVRVDAL